MLVLRLRHKGIPVTLCLCLGLRKIWLVGDETNRKAIIGSDAGRNCGL
jgi:hypothetical protein